MPNSKLDKLFSNKKNEISPDQLLNAVTEDMIDALGRFENTGEAPPWNQPWVGTGIDVVMGANRYAVTSDPRNIGTPRKPYTFPLNQFILYFVGFSRGYTTNFWITHERIKKIGATLKKNARSVSILKFPSGHACTPVDLYHVEDVEDYQSALGMTVVKKTLKKNFKEAEKFSKVLKIQGKMKFHEGSELACYIPSKDEIRMPYIAAFVKKSKTEGEAHYWATFFHECIHWTGHVSRLDRFRKSEFLDQRRVYYAEEELVAELGAAYLCPYLGIQNELQHPEYVHKWIKVLKFSSNGEGYFSENHPLIMASRCAAEAFEYLIDLVSEHKKKGKQ